MPLYFQERINEQKEDPLKDTIIFTYPWLLTPPPQQQDVISIADSSTTFRTKYKFFAARWWLSLQGSLILISEYDDTDINMGDGGSCFISYNLYSDNDMKCLMHSSPKIEMLHVLIHNSFYAHEGITKCKEAYFERKAAKLVIFVEMHLPMKHCYRPFERPYCHLNREFFDGYPKDIDSDFRFDFMKNSDYSINCPDGTMPAMKIVLNNASEFMYKHFETSGDEHEFLVTDSIDVVQPIIIFLHTRYFQMPKSFNLDFAKRLLKAFYSFMSAEENDYFFKSCVHKELCEKFVEERHTFNSILQWLSLAYQYNLHVLKNMITVVIADKYFYDWNQAFPENARNDQNPMFRDIFSLRGLGESSRIFDEVESIMIASFKTNVILN